VLASWHHVTPLWYAANSILPRPDLDIAYVYPEGAEPIGETWRRRLTETDPPVVVTNRSGEMIRADAVTQPLPGTPFFTTDRTWCLDGDDVRAVGATFGDQVVLEAVHIPEPSRPAPMTPLVTEFAVTGTVEEPLTVFAQLVDPVSGAIYGQVDHTVSAARWNGPGGLLDRLPIVPFREELPPLQVAVGVYRRTNDGLERLAPRLPNRSAKDTKGATGETDVFPFLGPDRTVVVGNVRVPSQMAGQVEGRLRQEQQPFLKVMVFPPHRPHVFGILDAALGLGRGNDLRAAAGPGPPTDVEPPAAAVPFGDAMWLVDTAVRREGDQLVVDLTWLAEHAFVSDYTVSVHARGDGWSAQHDGTPAQGAIPTLKWLPGMVIHDRHRIDLPSDVPPGSPYALTVGVYDAFSLEPLPVTHRDLVSAGQGQRVVIAGDAH
jgi:hypothetical protein